MALSFPPPDLPRTASVRRRTLPERSLRSAGGLREIPPFCKRSCR
jgi:hypothetical protein